MNELRLPPDTKAALIPGPGRGATISLTPPDLTDASFSALLTHDRGTDWPDATGRDLIAEMLALGHPAVLCFESHADARRCFARVERLTRQFQ